MSVMLHFHVSLLIVSASCSARRFIIQSHASESIDGPPAQHTPLTRLTDLALAAVLPLHMHVGVNGVVSDYVPPRYIGARLVLLGSMEELLLDMPTAQWHLPHRISATESISKMWVYVLQAQHGGACWQPQASRSWGL